MVHCNFLTNTFDLVYLPFAVNVLMVHLCTEVTAASWLLVPFGEIGGDVPEYFSSENDAVKSYCKNLIIKNFTAGFFRPVDFLS